jgi:hypothetical protein
VNHAAITMSGSGYFNLNTGGSFTNSADATVEIQHNTYAFYGGAAGLVLSNAGSITRTTSSGTAYINNLSFTNTGIVESQTGTLDIYPYTQDEWPDDPVRRRLRHQRHDLEHQRRNPEGHRHDHGQHSERRKRVARPLPRQR